MRRYSVQITFEILRDKMSLKIPNISWMYRIEDVGQLSKKPICDLLINFFVCPQKLHEIKGNYL